MVVVDFCRLFICFVVNMVWRLLLRTLDAATILEMKKKKRRQTEIGPA